MKNYRKKKTQEIIRVITMILLIGIQPLFGQNGVLIATSPGTANGSAMLDIVSTSKGVLVPRMTSAQRIAINPTATEKGLLVFQTDAPVGFYYFDGSVWVQLSAGALGGTGTTNYLARWTSTNQLGTGATYDDGTNVGISTSSPTYKLTIAGTGNTFGVDNQATFAAKNSVGTYETFFWPRWSDNIMYMNYGSAGFNIRNNGSTSTMFMTNANDVGIGNVAPTAKLDITGTLKASGAANLNGGLFTQGTASTLYGTTAQIMANTGNVLGGGVMISDDGGFFDYNNGPVTFNGSTGLTIAGTSGAASSNCYLQVKQLAGTGTRPIWADANGTLNTSGRVYAFRTAESAAIGATNTAVLTTGNMSVVSGELIAITVAMELHFTTGSGNDRFSMQSQVNNVSGCTSAVISTTISAMPSADHQGYYTYFFTDLWVATCTGTVTFQCNANRFDADDTWTYRNARIMAIKQ
jgi:hypothetical protein